jgi:hypothetical protein
MTLPTDGGGGTGGGGGGGALAGLELTGRRRRTSTQEKTLQANVPTSGAGDATVPAKKKRQRDTVLTGQTGTGEEPNVYRPSIGAA